MEHSNIPVGEIHVPYQWVVADDAEREALSPEFGDLHKLCLQLNPETEWRLASISPVLWVPRVDCIRLTAGAALGGHRIVIIDQDSRAQYASSMDVSHALKIIGLTRGAAVEGDMVAVQRAGRITESSWNWAPGQPVFLGDNGLLTQVPPSLPTSLFSLIVGFPIAPTSLFLSLREPILLGE